MILEVEVKEVVNSTGCYFYIDSDLFSAKVFSPLKKEELLENKDNPKFFFDVALDDLNEELDFVDASSVKGTLLKVQAKLVEVDKNDKSSDILISLHQSDKKQTRVIFVDCENRYLHDGERSVFSDRNIYTFEGDTQIDLTDDIFSVLGRKNSHKRAGNRLAPLVINDKLADEEEYHVVDFKRYKIEY